MKDFASFSSNLQTMPFILGRLHSQNEAEMIANNLDGVFSEFNEFTEALSDEAFPCLFGRRAWKDKTNKFLFCGRLADGGQEHFRRGLLEYTEFVKKTPVRERLFSPLIISVVDFIKEPEKHHLMAWQLMQYLIDNDKAPWPDNVPIDVDNPLWTFCFNNVQLFFNISTPAHQVLRSRRLSSCLTLVVNPRENFDVVANSKERSGQLIRQKIRDRVRDYNAGFVPAELGFFGHDDNFEWKQFQVSEPNLPGPSQCPLRIKNKEEDRC